MYYYRFSSIYIIFLCISFYANAGVICGTIGNIGDRIVDCKIKNVNDEKIKEYLEKGFFVYSVGSKNEYYFTDEMRKWGFTEAKSSKHSCQKPYKKIKKTYYKKLQDRGIATDKGYHRCAMRVDRYLMITPSRKERFE